ncbi:hypothetical protein [Paenibacillus crassostreae]|uniref:Lipoprotein n=1 Tax=Paenibacillus crassostreae TaxID=1763538 RepID=A0A167DVY4_9BACL|nr:hypothetical protein [Paenibacillus crassostreae]AOZ90996.1 hypothetical protein LPB68_01445 [Paenibacillus crassostreae]OAB74841.1 hypothetical protein PNBC_12510 [Paenibacillus crassostreae]
MKSIRVIAFLFVVLFLLSSCNKKETINDLDFSLYKTSELSTDSGEAGKIVEENSAIITSNDIDSYLWDGKVLKVNINKVHEKLGGQLNQGFVFKIDEKKVYYGAFINPLSSYRPDKNVKMFLIDMPNQEQFIEIYRTNS